MNLVKQTHIIRIKKSKWQAHSAPFVLRMPLAPQGGSIKIQKPKKFKCQNYLDLVFPGVFLTLPASLGFRAGCLVCVVEDRGASSRTRISGTLAPAKRVGAFFGLRARVLRQVTVAAIPVGTRISISCPACSTLSVTRVFVSDKSFCQ